MTERDEEQAQKAVSDLTSRALTVVDPEGVQRVVGEPYIPIENQ